MLQWLLQHSELLTALAVTLGTSLAALVIGLTFSPRIKE